MIRRPPPDADRRGLLLSLFQAAVQSVQASTLLPPFLPKDTSRRYAVIAVGKAAAEMAKVACERLGDNLFGMVAAPAGYDIPGHAFPPSFAYFTAGHPTPTASSLQAGQAALEICEGLTEDDHLLALISGGGSALMTAPAEGLSLADKQGVNRALLLSGAAISEMNCVRKHLSRVKGGRLAIAAAPARVTTLILSDIPGDDPSLVASGPTVEDQTSLRDVRAIVARYGLRLDPHVAAALNDPANETPHWTESDRDRCALSIIGTARTALDAAAAHAAAADLKVIDLGDEIEGEAREIGQAHATLAKALTPTEATVILSGGETTVTVVNPAGKGGRNLEYLLSLALALDGAPNIWAIACDTDGIDGTEDAAGAYVTPDTLIRAAKLGLNAQDMLSQNNAYSFFEALGDLVVPGPTRTNVNDFRAILVESRPAT